VAGQAARSSKRPKMTKKWKQSKLAEDQRPYILSSKFQKLERKIKNSEGKKNFFFKEKKTFLFFSFFNRELYLINDGF
jgi:hypothetical protein